MANFISAIHFPPEKTFLFQTFCVYLQPENQEEQHLGNERKTNWATQQGTNGHSTIVGAYKNQRGSRRTAASHLRLLCSQGRRGDGPTLGGWPVGRREKRSHPKRTSTHTLQVCQVRKWCWTPTA